MESDRPEDTLPFAGHLLCFTGITDERVDLQSKVIKMGARNVLPDLTLDVTALISRGYDSLKYVVRETTTFTICPHSLDWHSSEPSNIVFRYTLPPGSPIRTHYGSKALILTPCP